MVESKLVERVNLMGGFPNWACEELFPSIIYKLDDHLPGFVSSAILWLTISR